jgi:cytochrome c
MARCTVLLLIFGAGCSGDDARRTAADMTGGSAQRGRVEIQRYGCEACHSIPGVRSARSYVGPALDGLGRRSYIAGHVSNTPDNLIRFLIDPRSVSPRTAMPATGLTEQAARDIAAYLYTLQ